MLRDDDKIPQQNIGRVSTQTRIALPFFEEPVSCGFPDPTEAHWEKMLDANDKLVYDQDTTYYVTTINDSMIGDHIRAGDTILIDSSMEPRSGRIVLAWVADGFTLKRIRYTGELKILEPSNPDYLPIYIQPGEPFHIFGVATWCLNDLLTARRV